MVRIVNLDAPGSKSLTQRALILAALAPGESEILDPAECDDSHVLAVALEALGATIHRERARWSVRGAPRLRAVEQPLWCGDAGTVMRFLAPLCLLADGPLTLDGSAQLRQRPLGPVVAALAELGVQATFLGQPGGLPVRLSAGPALGDEARVDVSQSSQFASGLMMVGPCLRRGLRLELAGATVSRPYLDMTVQAMRQFGADPSGSFSVPPGAYRACTFQVERDWSAAAFLLAAGRITGCYIHVEHLAADSIQGDRAIVDLLAELDVPRPHRFDLTDCPDLIAPLATACVFASHPSEIVGAAHARIKESDRVAVLAAQLRRAGVRIEERRDGLCIQPGSVLVPSTLDPHGDHRMAMAFGLLALRQPLIRVDNPGCVSKSFGDFWKQLERLS